MRKMMDDDISGPFSTEKYGSYNIHEKFVENERWLGLERWTVGLFTVTT
jgi:hypothetical protein